MSIVVAATTISDLSSFHLSPSSSSFYLWNSHLSHVSSSCLRFLTSTRTLKNLKTCDIFYCSGCKLAKFSILPFNWRISISSSSSDLIYFDVWGPSPVAIKRGFWYYVFFIDDHTHFCWAYLMKYRSEFFKIHTGFRAHVKTQYSILIKCFRCDFGEEYTSNKFCELLALYKTIYRTSCTDTFEQNRVTKRKYRHIVETARSLLLSTSVPSEFWGEAILTIVSLINIIHLLIFRVFLLSKIYMGMSLIIPPSEFFIVLVSFFILM